MTTTLARGPLAGLRVIELAGIGPAPYACLLLAELGAEVIRVDRPHAVGGAPAVSEGLVFADAGRGPEPRVAPVFSRSRILAPRPVRPVGGDTRSVLAAAGLDAHELDDLIQSGVVRQA
jgi:crotonobetainyl-CoA:carnitine CoA-transferase CaiB-like acyl-CoA transferase